MRKIPLIFVMLCFLPSLVFAKDLASKEEEAFLLGAKAFNDGFYDASSGILENFLSDYPNSKRIAEVNLYIGRCFLCQNKVNEALNKFLEGLSDLRASDIKDALYYWVAEAYFRKKAYPEAAIYYKRLITEYPQSAYITDYLNFYLAEAFYYQEKFEEAESFYEKALAGASSPKAKNLFNLSLGWNALKRKNYARAKEIFTQIPLSELDERSQGICLLGRATLSAYENNFSEALAIFNGLIDSAKDNEILLQAYLGEADCFFGEAKYEDAALAYQNVLSNPDIENVDKKFLSRVYSSKAQSHFFSGASSFERGNIEQALAEYEKALDSPDKNMVNQAATVMAKIYKDEAHFDKAIRYLQKAQETAKAEDKPYLIFQTAECYEEEAKFSQAIERYAEIASLYNENNPFFVKALLRIARIYENGGQIKEAKDAYQKVMSFNIKEADYAREKFAVLGN